MSFRYKRGIDLDYNDQGRIYFHCLAYKTLPQREQEKIRKVCEQAGGAYAPALLEFVTTEKGYTATCMKYNLSKSQLYRLVKDFYETFASK